MQTSLSEKWRQQKTPDQTSIQVEMANLFRFIDKTKRSILLSHNQSLEQLRQKALVKFEDLTQELNSILATEHGLTTQTLKINRKGS